MRALFAACLSAALAPSSSSSSTAACELFAFEKEAVLGLHRLAANRAAPFPPGPPSPAGCGAAATAAAGRVTVAVAGAPTQPVTRLYAEDQHGEVVAFGRFSTGGPASALVFTPTPGATAVTPFAFCEGLGLFAGAPLQLAVPAAGQGGGSPLPCAFDPCFPGGAGGFKEEMLSWHTALTGASAPWPSSTQHDLGALAGFDGNSTVRYEVPDGMLPGVLANGSFRVGYVAAACVYESGGGGGGGGVVAAKYFTPGSGGLLEFYAPATGSLTLLVLHTTLGAVEAAPFAVPSQGLRGAGDLFRNPPPDPCPHAVHAVLVCYRFEAVRAEARRRHREIAGMQPPLEPAASPGLPLGFAVSLAAAAGDRLVLSAAFPNASAAPEAAFVMDAARNVVLAGTRLPPPAATTAAGSSFAFPALRAAGVATARPYALFPSVGLAAGANFSVPAAAARGTPPPCDEAAVESCGGIPRLAGDLGGFKIPAAPTRNDTPKYAGPCAGGNDPSAAVQSAALARQHGAAFAPGANAAREPSLSVEGIVGVVVTEAEAPSGGAFVDALYVADQNAAVVAAGVFDPPPYVAGAPGLAFLVPFGAEKLTAFALWNTHGLYRSIEVNVTHRDLPPAAAPRRCGLLVRGAGNGARFPGCPSWELEKEAVLARHALVSAPPHLPFSAPGGGGGGGADTPVLKVSAADPAAATISVESDPPAGAPSPRPASVHYTTHLFVENECGVVVAMAKLLPSSPTRNVTFAVPPGTRELVPYAMCNVHGLHRGAAVAVEKKPAGGDSAAGGGAAQPPGGCGYPECFRPRDGDAGGNGTCPVFDALRADAAVWQAQLTGRAGGEPGVAGVADGYWLRAAQVGTRLEVSIGGDGGGGAAGRAFNGGPAGDVVAVFFEETEAPNAVLSVVAPDPYLGFPIQAAFEIPERANGSITVTLLSTRHGLLSFAPPVAVDPVPSAATQPICSVPACGGVPTPPRCRAFALRAAEMRRRQNDSAAFPPEQTPFGRLHSPFAALSADGRTVTITVGKHPGDAAAPGHPTVASVDPAAVHFIQSIYATDSAGGAILAMAEHFAAASEPALVFEVPAGVRSVTPFAFCNRHGLFSGAPLPVRAHWDAQPAACQFSGCGGGPAAAGAARCELFDVLEADAQRRHNGRAAKAAGGGLVVSEDGLGGVVTVAVDRRGSAGLPWVATPDPAALQYVEYIYVKDADTLETIAAASFNPTDPQPSIAFRPLNATKALLPFVYHNREGFLEFPVHTIRNATLSDELPDEPLCALYACGGRAACPELVDRRREMRARDAYLRAQCEVACHRESKRAGAARPPPEASLAADAGGVVHLAAAGRVEAGGAALDGAAPPPSHDACALYAVDQSGEILAAGGLTAAEKRLSVTDQFAISFEVPSGTTSVTVFSYYSGLGITEGPTLAVRGASGGSQCLLPAATAASSAGGGKVTFLAYIFGFVAVLVGVAVPWRLHRRGAGPTFSAEIAESIASDDLFEMTTASMASKATANLIEVTEFRVKEKRP
ncbi:hypothetical protein DIPPA_14385 [Diplonema papillatum]|nr:hypothetical protein DIPPA_14385 [Diplonema papillatum]